MLLDNFLEEINLKTESYEDVKLDFDEFLINPKTNSTINNVSLNYYLHDQAFFLLTFQKIILKNTHCVFHYDF